MLLMSACYPGNTPSGDIGCCPAECAREKVLLVEDEEPLARLGQLILSRAGLSVIRAGTGEEALRVLGEHAAEIAMAFVDFRLPDMDGDKLCQQLREAAPGLPLLLTSGRSRRTLPADLGAGGPVGFVSKPYLPADLVTQALTLLRPVGA